MTGPFFWLFRPACQMLLEKTKRGATPMGGQVLLQLPLRVYKHTSHEDSTHLQCVST